MVSDEVAYLSYARLQYLWIMCLGRMMVSLRSASKEAKRVRASSSSGLESTPTEERMERNTVAAKILTNAVQGLEHIR